MLAERHVRRLTLRSRERVATARITNLLEDAIRTASLPNIPANGIVCIRRLDLGRISTSTDSHSLSRRLDQLIRNLTFTHITAQSPEQDDAAAAWFADAVEPYRVLSELIAKGHSPRAWYWSVAVSHWSASLNALDSVLLCLSQLAEKPTGITGISYALEPFVRRGAMMAVLENIETKALTVALHELTLASVSFSSRGLAKQDRADADVDVHRSLPYAGLGLAKQDTSDADPTAAASVKAQRALPDTGPGLAKQDMSGADVTTYATANIRLPTEWKRCLRQALQRWKPSDVRLRLVLSMALQKAGIKPTIENVIEFVQAIQQQDRPWTGDSVNSTSIPKRLRADHSSATESQESSLQQVISKEIAAETPYSQNLHENRMASRLCMNDDEVVDEENHVATVLNDTPQIERNRAQEQPPELAIKPRRQDRRPTKPEQQSLIYHYSGEISPYGGFVFLVSALQRLGMTKLFESHTEDVDLQLAQRVLWRIAGWLRIPADDPVLQFLEQPSNYPPGSLAFVAPRQWQALLKHGSDTRLQLARALNQPGKRLIKDPVSRLILGVWQTDNIERVRHWVDHYELQLQSDPPRAWKLDVYLDNVVIAICRYVRYYAQMSVRRLIKRPAYITCTPTHVDWSASLATLDYRVRMAGLDIDPGWVSSLQRVFHFHYIDEEA